MIKEKKLIKNIHYGFYKQNPSGIFERFIIPTVSIGDTYWWKESINDYPLIPHINIHFMWWNFVFYIRILGKKEN